MEIVTLPDGSKLNVQIVKILGDGSCLFRALSYLLFGNEERHLQIRVEIVEYIMGRWEEYQMRTCDVVGNPYTTCHDYEQAMTRRETYGSACEIQAASEIFLGYCFEIYMERKHVYSFGSGIPKRLRFSGNLQRGHYDAYDEVCNVGHSKRRGNPDKPCVISEVTVKSKMESVISSPQSAIGKKRK